MSRKSYTIDQVSWHTQVQGNREPKLHVDARFRALFGFLFQHQLLSERAPSLPTSGALSEELCLRSDHLTDLGLETMRVGYDKWLAALDKGTSPSKTTILENALRKVRARAQPTLQADDPAFGGPAA